ncbi:MAG: phenylalanine--tRNA ligase subunit alpha [Candidatus Paceibacterota bacterium]
MIDKAEQPSKLGHLHPNSQIIYEVYDLMRQLGFSVALGPEVETEFYNFDALNIPPDHPARDMQDTFWLKAPPGLPGRAGPSDQADRPDDRLLRTHTSPVQIRYMQEHQPPFRIIAPGRVFRNEATDATHEAQFHQVEGLMVDRDVSLSHLKGTLEFLLKGLFGDDVRLRLRPSFFSFVEPGLEVDISCFRCGGRARPDDSVGRARHCILCKQTGWIEVLGAGLVHPNVLSAGGLDPNEWRGFAFGVGVDRLSMLRYGVDDVRLFYAGDIRFINQF